MGIANPAEDRSAITTLRDDGNLEITGADLPSRNVFFITTGGLVELPVDKIKLCVIRRSYTRDQTQGEVVVDLEGPEASGRARFTVENGSLRSVRGSETRVASVDMPMAELQDAIEGTRVTKWDLEAIWLKETLEKYFAANAGVWEAVQEICAS